MAIRVHIHRKPRATAKDANGFEGLTPAFLKRCIEAYKKEIADIEAGKWPWEGKEAQEKGKLKIKGLKKGIAQAEAKLKTKDAEGFKPGTRVISSAPSAMGWKGTVVEGDGNLSNAVAVQWDNNRKTGAVYPRFLKVDGTKDAEKLTKASLRDDHSQRDLAEMILKKGLDERTKRHCSESMDVKYPPSQADMMEYLMEEHTKSDLVTLAAKLYNVRDASLMARAADALATITGTKDVGSRLGTASKGWPSMLAYNGVRYLMARSPNNELPGGEETRIYLIDDEDEISSSTPKRIQVTKTGVAYRDAAMSKDAYPQSVKYTVRGKVKEYWKTGKEGKRIDTGKPVAEYASDDDGRVWVDADGKIYPDSP